MRILLASSEVHPFSKTGGLADMVGALAKTLARKGHEVGLVTPLYAGIREQFSGIKKFDWKIDLPLGARRLLAEVWTLKLNPRLTIYFIRQPEYYDRAGLYQEKGREYGDNAERFVFLSKCVVQLARYLPWKPELVHVHDWQTGLVPLFIRHQALREGWSNAPQVCLTIHNMAYQGNFPAASFPLTNLPPAYFNPNGVEFYGRMNCLKAGIVFADAITTVSPRYAREIRTEPFGCGLHGLMEKRKDALFGILNGVNYEEWKTTGNPFLRHSFSPENLFGKASLKLDLQRESGFAGNAHVPLFATVGRLADQKGVDILLGTLEEMLAADLQFVLLGSGDPEWENAFRELALRQPGKLAAHIGFDEGLSHRIEAGADFFVMPSRYEPCGLNQMYSQRYGTIPIVRATGGLDDSVVDIGDDPVHATGIKFSELSPPALSKAIRKAITIFQEPEMLRRYRLNGMKADFSWDRTGEQYVRIYEVALNR
jgi:starch synthase